MIMDDAILFSVDPTIGNINDAIQHLASHNELYWEVKFPIMLEKFAFPIEGYIHIKGERVKYKATISNIVPFDHKHYEDGRISKAIKPQPWIKEWEENIDQCRDQPWRNHLVITHIEPFEYDTYKLNKYENGHIKLPPQGYVRVIPPTQLI